MKKLCILLLFLFSLSAPALAAPELPEQQISIGHISDIFVVAPGGELVAWGTDETNLMALCGADISRRLHTDGFSYADRMTLISGGVKAVQGTYFGLLALMDDGTLYGFGLDFQNCFAGRAPENYSRAYALYNNGSLYPVKIMEDVASICGNFDFFTALKTDGSVWVWGTDYYSPVKVMEGCRYATQSYAITKDGGLYCLDSGEYICSGVFAIDGGLLQMENGDLYRFEDYLAAAELGSAPPEPIAVNVRKLCSGGYITEDSALYCKDWDGSGYIRVLENVEHAFCWPYICLATTCDGKVYSSEMNSSNFTNMEYLGPLDELAPEYERSFNPWPVILQAELVFRKLLSLLPVLL